jgi:hypothetical protein
MAIKRLEANEQKAGCSFALIAAQFSTGSPRVVDESTVPFERRDAAVSCSI